MQASAAKSNPSHQASSSRAPAKSEPSKKSPETTSHHGNKDNTIWRSVATAVGTVQRQPEQDSIENDDIENPHVQLKSALSIGAVDDPFEKEADAVADQVTGQSGNTQAPLSLQLSTGENTSSSSDEIPNVQTKSASGPANSSSTSGNSSTNPSSNVSSLVSSPSSGSPLSQGLRSRIEPAVGADLSSVRVHSDERSQAAAADIQAKAFTHQNNIFLGAGQSANDVGLMAHEATHTVQQTSNNLSSSIMRFPSVTKTPAETSHTPATIKAMSLSQFSGLTNRQLDWATSTAIQADAAALGDFRSLKTFSLQPRILETCGSFKIGDLMAKGIPTIYTPLQTYAKGVKAGTTAWLPRTTSLPTAEGWGKDLATLEAAWPAANLSLIMRRPEKGKSPFEKLVDPANRELGNFITYLSTCNPILSATDGSEIDSFLALRKEGVMPHSYFGSIKYVTNYHHFTKATLDGLVANEAFPASKQNGRWSWFTQRPLTVVMHPAVDNNGAFHRNMGLEALVKNTSILTIVIEGHTLVSGYEATLAPVAARYGIGGKIKQAIVGGHGNSTSLELAGGMSGASIAHDNLGTGGTSGSNTTSLMTELTRLMSSDPAKRRIILNACLTDSHHVSSALRASPADAAADVQTAIAAKPSLRKFVENIVGSGSKVYGANASYAPGQTTFLKSGSSDITLQVSSDPDLVASKLEYVEFGTEPEGCMRAVLEAWAADQKAGTTKCQDAMKRRILAGKSAHMASADPWREAIIQPLYDLVVNHYWSNGEAIRQLGELAGKLFLMYWKRYNVSGLKLNRYLSVISGSPAHVNKLFTSISGQSRYRSVPRVAAVIEQVWMQYNTTRRSHFMTALGKFTDALDASAHVNMSLVMPSINHLLSLPPASPPPADQFRLALMAANHDPLSSPAPSTLPRHIDFLQQLLGAGPMFPSSLNIRTALGGLTTEEGILTAIGRSLTGTRIITSGSTPPPPDANIDLDRDGTNLNDFRVTPLRANGVVNLTRMKLRVRSRPTTSTSRNIITALPPGTPVKIIGTYGNWYAVEQPGRTGFMYKRYITIVP